jgi:hypothetical protein
MDSCEDVTEMGTVLGDLVDGIEKTMDSIIYYHMNHHDSDGVNGVI